MMLEKVVISKQFWLLATEAAYKQECTTEKHLTTARKPMSKGYNEELTVILT